MSWVTDNWIPLTVVGGLVGVSWYAGKHFDESESYNADEGIQVTEGYNEWWDELENIRGQYPPDKFFNRRLGNPKWEDVLLEQMFKDGWTPKQALYSWKYYNGAVGHFTRPPNEIKMKGYSKNLHQASKKICKNCGEQGHNTRSCTNERVRDVKYANDKSTRLKLSRKINALFKLGEGEQNTTRYINYGLGALAAGRDWDSPKMDFPIHFEHHGHPYVDNSGKWKLVEKHWGDIQDMRDDLGVDDFKEMIDTTKWEIGQPNWNAYMSESYNASTKKTKPIKTRRIKTMIELNPDLHITSHNHPDNPMVGHIEQKCSSDVCDETVLTHDRRIGKRCLKCYYQNWEDLYDMGATDTPPPVDMSIPYDVRYKRNTPAEIAEQEKRSIARQKQINANRSKRYEERYQEGLKNPLWSKNPKNILGVSWEDFENDREWDKQYAQILKDKKKMSEKGWRKKYGLKSESYNADEKRINGMTLDDWLDEIDRIKATKEPFYYSNNILGTPKYGNMIDMFWEQGWTPQGILDAWESYDKQEGHWEKIRAETFNADDWEYTEEWYNSALPRIVKRVKEELVNDERMKLDDPKMYALFEDEMFDGEPTSLDSYVYSALELEYPTLTEKQKIEISEDADMLSDVWFGIDMTDEEFRDWLNEEYDDEGNLISRAETFNADEGLWNDASKEQRLKWLKDAIPSIGDKYADYTWRELTPRLQEEMADESYDAETFAAYVSPSLKLTENQESKLRWFMFAYEAHSMNEPIYIDEVLGDISPNLWTQATTVGIPFTIEKISRKSIMRNASKASDDENAKRMQKSTLSQLVKKGIFEVNESFENKEVPFTINVKLTAKAKKAVMDDIDDLRSLHAETFAAYVSKADTQRVRQLLKQEFPNLKFSVVKDGGRMSVSIMAGDIDFSDINDDVPRTKRYWERWGNPKPVFDGKLDINQYHLDGYNPKYTPLFEKIVSIMKGEDWFDHSDSQTDYFHTAYYIDLNIGKWNKPYEYKPTIKRGTRPTLESLVYKQGYGDDALTGLKGAYDEETFEAKGYEPNKPYYATMHTQRPTTVMHPIKCGHYKMVMGGTGVWDYPTFYDSIEEMVEEELFDLADLILADTEDKELIEQYKNLKTVGEARKWLSKTTGTKLNFAPCFKKEYDYDSKALNALPITPIPFDWFDAETFEAPMKGAQPRRGRYEVALPLDKTHTSAIRKALKDNYKGFNFSVKMNGNTTVVINLKSGKQEIDDWDSMENGIIDLAIDTIWEMEMGDEHYVYFDTKDEMGIDVYCFLGAFGNKEYIVKNAETFEAPLARGRGRVGYQYEFCLNKEHSKTVRQKLKKEYPQLKIRIKIDNCNTMLAWLISGNQDLNDENFDSLKEAIEQTMMDALENMDDTDGENINVFCYLGDWTKNQEYTQNAETFEASAVARKKAKTPVEKVLLHEELMNQAARNEMITKLTYDLAMRRGVHRQPMRTIKEAEYDSKLKKEFGDD